MVRSFDDMEREARNGVCPEHGAFASTRIVGKLWSRCPACSQRQHDEEAAQQEQRSRAAAEAQHRKWLSDTGISRRFEGRTFDAFVAKTGEQRQALSVFRDFAEQFDDNRARGQGLVAAGQPGTGKTLLVSALLQALEPRRVRYLTAPDLILEVRDAWRRDSTRSQSRVLDDLGTLDLVVIDEIGVGNGTENEQLILFETIDRRYRNMLPTVFVTNCDRAGFRQALGERAFDRVTEIGRWVPFDWTSYRPQARKEEQALGRACAHEMRGSV